MLFPVPASIVPLILTFPLEISMLLVANALPSIVTLLLPLELYSPVKSAFGFAL